MREQLKWYGEKADNSPWIARLLNFASGPPVKATAINTFRRSPSLLIKTRRRRWAIAITFSTSRMALTDYPEAGLLRQKACTPCRGPLAHVVSSVTHDGAAAHVDESCRHSARITYFG